MTVTLTIVDVNEPGLAHRDDYCDWLERHGVEPRNTYRVDNVNDEFMVVHQYAVREDGRKFVVLTDEDVASAYKPVVGEAALRGPFALRIQEPMPR